MLKAIYSVYLITGTDDLYNEFLWIEDFDHYPEDWELTKILDFQAPVGFNYVSIEKVFTREDFDA